jgi:hypothetical protein
MGEKLMAAPGDTARALEEMLAAARREGFDEGFAEGFAAGLAALRDRIAKMTDPTPPGARRRAAVRRALQPGVYTPVERGTNANLVEAALRSVAPKSCGPTELIHLVAGATGKPLPYTSVMHALNQLERRQAARKVSSNRWQYMPEKERQ